MWAEGFLTAFQPLNLVYLVLGTAVGMVIGALPGLGPLFAVSLMLPLTFGMPPATAIIFLTAVHAATAYGDSFASIIINTPGGVGSVASCWDGSQWRKGTGRRSHGHLHSPLHWWHHWLDFFSGPFA
jgi:putative tricarboxylic transport membrane protein